MKTLAIIDYATRPDIELDFTVTSCAFCGEDGKQCVESRTKHRPAICTDCVRQLAELIQ